MQAVACPSTTQCTGVDYDGREVTFNPTSPGGPAPVDIDSYRSVAALACPSTSQCTAVDSSGRAVTFNPNSPLYPSVASVDSGYDLYGIACPSTSLCATVDTVPTNVLIGTGPPLALSAPDDQRHRRAELHPHRGSRLVALQSDGLSYQWEL